MNTPAPLAAIAALASSTALAQPANQPANQSGDGTPQSTPRADGMPEDFPEVKGPEDFMNLSFREQELFMRFNRPFLNFFSGVNSTFVAPADFDGGNGSVGRLTVGGEFGPAFRVSPKANFAIQMGASVTSYDFDDAAGLLSPAVPGAATITEPFDEVLELDIRPVLDYRGDDWSYFAGLGIGSAGEAGADFGDTLTYSAFGGVAHEIDDKWTVGLGGSASRDLDGEFFVIAFPILGYKFTDKLSARTDPGLRGGVIGYQLREDLELGLFGSFQRRQFRLSDDAAVSDGIVTDTAIPVGLAATYRPNRQFIATGVIGAHVWGELDFDDEDGDDLIEREIDPTPFASIRLSIRF